MVTVIHTDYRGDSRPDRANKASIEVKYFVDTASRHTCPDPLWPDDTYTGNDARWHQISSDIDQWPLLANHWYKVKVVFNSDNTSGGGDDGAPVDIFLDDQGETGLDDVTQLWEGYVNASKSIQDSSSCRWGAKPGDYIATENQPAFIGTPRPPGSGIHAATHIFDGDIDWVTWKPIADYSDVQGAPPFGGSSILANNSYFGSTAVNEPYDSSEDLGMSAIILNPRYINNDQDDEQSSGAGPDTMSSASSEVFIASSNDGASPSGISHIRVCEGCHGYDSLHNIQTDSNSDDLIDVGMELAGYGHVGSNDDCWGCHGFFQSMAPGSGPIVPTITDSDISVITEGSDTAVTLTGTAFTNVIWGYPLTSIVRLTAADGSLLELTPDAVSEGSLTVTIPGTIPIGNYDVRALKGNTESNQVVISVKPAVTITDVKCRKRRGRLTITGSGFGEKAEGTDDYINVEVNGVPVEIISWKDNRIKASVTSCIDNANIAVNALFGSVSTGDKPPKPGKGK
jgi:hypothetical protein